MKQVFPEMETTAKLGKSQKRDFLNERLQRDKHLCPLLKASTISCTVMTGEGAAPRETSTNLARSCKRHIEGTLFSTWREHMCINYTSVQFLCCMFASASAYRLLNIVQYLTCTNKFAVLLYVPLFALLAKTSPACFISDGCRATLCTVHQGRMNAVCLVLARNWDKTGHDGARWDTAV